MPRLEPFSGFRYDLSAVRLDQVISPPYDVIGSAERTRLATRSPLNSVHVELPEPDLRAGLDRYQVAAATLASWRERRVLVPDPSPCLYPYRTTQPDGRTSTGVIGALEVGEGVLAHEQTLAKPRSDRLDLLRATGANLSPIWGLSLTTGLTASFDPEGPPAADAFDDDGVRHQLWVLDDLTAIDKVCDAVAASPVVIADGHHRYETAAAYRAEVRAAHGDVGGDHDLVMALVVELAEDQLTVGPVHRILADLPDGADLPGALGRSFDVVHAGPPTRGVVGALGESGALALVSRHGAWLLAPRAEAVEHVGTDLDAALVDRAVSELGDVTVTYRYGWEDALAAVDAGEGEAAVLLRPVTVSQIAEWAAAGSRMPPKTTYFSPKPRTGMVFRLLDPPVRLS